MCLQCSSNPCEPHCCVRAIMTACRGPAVRQDQHKQTHINSLLPLMAFTSMYSNCMQHIVWEYAHAVWVQHATPYFWTALGLLCAAPSLQTCRPGSRDSTVAESNGNNGNVLKNARTGCASTCLSSRTRQVQPQAWCSVDDLRDTRGAIQGSMQCQSHEVEHIRVGCHPPQAQAGSQNLTPAVQADHPPVSIH